MSTLSIEKNAVLSAYRNSNSKGKELLEHLFGSKTFNQKITDLIKSFEDACEYKGVDPDFIPDVSYLPKQLRGSQRAYYKLSIIAEALRDGWVPSFFNTNENKYYPWFYIRPEKLPKELQGDSVPAGVGDADNGFNGGVLVLNSSGGASSACAFYGGALASRTSETAIYFGNQFRDLWAEYLIPDLSAE
jgi:hypothetical protein